MSTNYRELERKYGTLTSIMSSQNQFIARLEKQCKCRESSQSSPVGSRHACCISLPGCHAEPKNVFCFAQVPTERPKSHSNVHPNFSSEGSEMTNDVQRDQSASSPQQERTAPDISTTAASPPTDPPFISPPVTKTPGRTVSSLSVCVCPRVCLCVRVCVSELFSCLEKQFC